LKENGKKKTSLVGNPDEIKKVGKEASPCIPDAVRGN
jgi:hypothetical protein